jgi:putative membrane protein
MLGVILVVHLFAIIFWIGSLLVITTLLGQVADEVGGARERLIMASRRLLGVAGNITMAVALTSGVILLALEPAALRQGWMHAKLLMVAALLLMHGRLYRRIIALENEPSGASRREFMIVHGAVSLLLLIILILAVLRPF